uniref:DUF1618 domain-containing protein n=1 Tax=Oryza meridionalis TaxID=40149 RepID=A0A0E0EUT5_9ORYZ
MRPITRLFHGSSSTFAPTSPTDGTPPPPPSISATAITFCIAPPPLVSYICAWSPTTDPAEFFAKEPAVGFVNANLVFLRVHSDQIYDFVYQASSSPSLKLIHNPYSPYNPYHYLRRIDNVVVLPVPDRHHAGAAADDDSGRFCVSALDRDRRFDLGHFKLCLYDDNSIDHKWSNTILLLDQLRNPPDKDTVLHLTEKVLILDDEQPLVAFVDLWRGMVICNVLDNSTPGGSSYMPLPPELIDKRRTYNSCVCRNIAIVNGRLTVVRLGIYLDPDDDDDFCAWDLSTWSKPVTCLDNEWREDFMIESSDVSVDDTTQNVCLLPKLDGCPTTETLQLAHPTLSLMDAHIVYIMGKVDISDEKALVLTVDMANKRLQEVSVCDGERIVNDFDYAYTQSTISQYFTEAAAGVKGSLKRPLKFHMQYPHKRLGETISRSDPMDLHEPLQLDAGSDMGTKDETEDSNNPMDLE